MNKELLWKAYVAGFRQSAEGWNGEYPWYRDGQPEKIKDELRNGVDGFEDWYETHVVEFDCIDCGEHIVRPFNDDIDIEGLTPRRCGTCTLDRMAER